MPTDVAAITREHVEAFITDQLARLAPASAANRYSSLRPFFNWLVEEGEIKVSPMARMRKPKVPEHAPPIVTDAELTAILRACEGPSFDDRRDVALVSLFLSTGARLSEVANLRWTPEVPETNDADLDIMALAGWRGREMLSRYAKSAERERAIAAARRIDVGDRL